MGNCKPTYKGKRYNSLEELYRANGVNTQQAQQLYSSYLQTTNNPTIEGFKQWNKRQQQINELFDSNPELANSVYEALGFEGNTIEADIENTVTEALKEKIFRIGKAPFEKTEFKNINVYTRKKSDNEFSIAIDNKGKSIFGLVSAVLDFQRRDLNADSIYSPNPKGFILWDTFLKSDIATAPKSKVIVDNRFSIALGALKALKNNDIEFINFPERFKEDFKKEYTQFLKQEFSSVGFTDVTDNRLETIQISIDDLIRIINSKSSDSNKIITPEQKQQAQQAYSQYLDSLNKPDTNPILQNNQQEQVKKFAELQERLNNKEFIEGAKNAYENSERLKSFGTQEEYNDYIARVSLGIIKNPSSGDYNYTSQVKDIVYHGTPKISKGNAYEILNLLGQYKDDLITEEEYNERIKQFPENPVIEKFDKSKIGSQSNSGLKKGFYFSTNKKVALWNNSNNLYRVIVNSVNPQIIEGDNKKINFSKLREATEKGDVVYKNTIDALENNTELLGDTIAVQEPEQIHILGSKQDIEGFKAFVESNNTKTNNSELMSLNDVKIKQGVAYQQYLELINDEEFKARSLVSYKANLDLKTLGSQEQYLQFNAMQELNILESPNSSDSNIQSQINQTLFEEYVNSIQETDQIDPEQAKYLYDQLSGISPSQMLQTVTRFAEQKLNTTSRKVLMEIFNKVGSKNNVMINFLNKTGQKRSDGVLGWYSNGEVNYNINDITLDTYMHEFSHLWLKVLKARNKESYDVISKKTSDFIKSEHPIAKLINQRLSTYQGEFLIEEATAILAGFISLPSVMKYMGSELNLEDLGYDVISEMFGSDIANLYELVGEEFNQVNTLQDMDFSGSSLFSILDAFSQDVLNGNNPFEIYGETLEELKLRGDLDGYMENNTGPQNLVLDIASLKETLKNDVSSRKDFDQMSDTELSTMIDKNFNKFSYQKKDGQWVWSMGSIDLNIQVGQSGILSSSKVAIMEFIRNISKNQINSLKEIGQEIKVAQSSRKSSPTNNPAADIILKHYQTRYGNSKFTVETAKHMASVMGLNSGVHDIFTLDEALVKYPSIFGKVDVNLIKDLSVMVVLHNDPRGSNPQVQISLFSLEKRNNYINPSKNRNIFNKFESVQDKDAIKSGVLLRNNSSSINNLMLGFVLGHLSDSISNLKIRTLGTFEMSKNFNPALIEMDVLFNSLGYIKNIPELFEMFQNETMKTIVEKASNHEYKNLQQAADDVLKTFYYNGIYYSASTEEFIKGKSTEYADMSSSERKSFIAARIKYLENYYGTSTKSSLISDPEYLLLSQELKRISDSKYMPSKYDEQGFRSELIKKLALPHNIKSDTVQWAINTIQTNERLVIHYFRQYRDKLHEVLRPVWDRHVSILPKLTDVGSSAFEHMFMRVQKDGVSFKLPYIYFDGHEKFKGLSESQKKAELTRLNLTQEDMALGNFIMDAVEDSLIESQFVDMQNAAMSVDQANKMTKDDAIDALMRKGWRKSSGQVFVISKSANELTASGRLKAGFARFVRQSIDINAIFEDQMLVTELGTLRNTLNSQLSHDKLLQMAGIESSSDGEYRLFDKDKNEAMSTNLETIANYAVMSNIRQMIHSRESESTYKAALAMIDDMQNVSSDSMERKSYDRLKEYIEDYWTSVVMGKRLDEDFTLWAGPSNTKVNLMAGVDMATRAMGFTLIAYKPIIMAKSYMYNIFNASVWAIGNLVGGEKGLPTPKDLLKAHADYVAHYTKCQAWMEHYQISNSSAYETLNSAVQNVSKKYALNSQMGFLGLQLTDEAMRHVTAIAYMMKNGSWDAHQYTVDSDGVGHLVYDETKDLRMYKDGKITDPGKAIRSAIKRDLVEEGLMKESDEKLLYGYDMQEAVMMRVLSDKWVVGSMSAESGANIVHTVLGRQFAKFRRFMFDNIANMGIGGNPSESRMLSNRIAIQDENGEWISLKEKKEISGTVQSFLAAFAFFKEHGVKGFTELDQLSAIHKANLAKSAAWVSLYFLLYALFGKFKDKEDQKKYLFDLHSWLRDTAVFQNVSDVDKTPIPMIGAFTNLIRTMYKDPIKTLYYLPGGGLVKDVTKSVQHYTD